MDKFESEKEEKSGGIFLASILIFVMLALATILVFLSVHSFTDRNKPIQNSLIKLKDENKKLNKSLERKTMELQNIRNKLSGIKNKDDLLKRDIRLYIKMVRPSVPNIVAKEISIQVVELSNKNNISPELVLGVIRVESSFNPMAVGPKTKYGNARGLMQVMPEWVKKFKIKSVYDLHNINIGIEAGIKVLQIHIAENKGDISSGLYHYVNKDSAYVNKVYSEVGKFVAYRSTLDNSSPEFDSKINIRKESNDAKS